MSSTRATRASLAATRGRPLAAAGTAGILTAALGLGGLAGWALWADRDHSNAHLTLAASYVNYRVAGADPVTVGPDNTAILDLSAHLPELAEHRTVAIPIDIEQVSLGTQAITHQFTHLLTGPSTAIDAIEVELASIGPDGACTAPGPDEPMLAPGAGGLTMAPSSDNAFIFEAPGDGPHRGQVCLRMRAPESLPGPTGYANTGTATGDWEGEPVQDSSTWATNVTPATVDWAAELGLGVDTDGDGTPDHLDPDIDGDGIPNHLDPDIDGDGIPNHDDPTPFGDRVGIGLDTTAKRLLGERCVAQ